MSAFASIHRTALLLAFTATAATPDRTAQSRHIPLWVTFTLSGHTMSRGPLKNTERDTLVIYDAKAGYYLEEYEGDGWRGLSLRRDRPTVTVDRRLNKRLPSLQTGHSVAIGDTLKQVKTRLGPPMFALPVGRTQDFEISYEFDGGELGLRWSYGGRYTFRKGRLRQIDLSYEDQPRLAG